jgi:hypothetical protein
MMMPSVLPLLATTGTWREKIMNKSKKKENCKCKVLKYSSFIIKLGNDFNNFLLRFLNLNHFNEFLTRLCKMQMFIRFLMMKDNPALWKTIVIIQAANGNIKQFKLCNKMQRLTHKMQIQGLAL